MMREIELIITGKSFNIFLKFNCYTMSNKDEPQDGQLGQEPLNSSLGLHVANKNEQ